MAARTFSKIAIWLPICPLIIASHFLEKMKIRWFIKSLKRCVTVVNLADEVPENLLQILLIAEDHRNDLHPGVDPIAILRAIFVRLSKNQIQGASTIEQQFVRVATGNYERTLARKVREQLLALAITRHCSKRMIAVAYLNIASFGTRSEGLFSFAENKAISLNSINDQLAISAIARLKYPEPLSASSSWNTRIKQRKAYIERRAKMAANNHSNQDQAAVVRLAH